MTRDKNWLQVVAQSHTTPVEVNDLRHRAIPSSRKTEPYPRAHQVVAVEAWGKLKQSPKPDRILRRFQAGFHHLPRRVVEVRRFSVRQVACMESPLVRWQLVQRSQPRYHVLRRSTEKLHNLCRLIRRLCTCLNTPKKANKSCREHYSNSAEVQNRIPGSNACKQLHLRSPGSPAKRKCPHNPVWTPVFIFGVGCLKRSASRAARV